MKRNTQHSNGVQRLSSWAGECDAADVYDG